MNELMNEPIEERPGSNTFPADPKTRKSRVPTFKQRLMVKELIKHKGNKTQAGLAAYDTKKPGHALQIVNRSLKQPKVQALYLKALEKAGLTDNAIAERWNEAVKVGWGVQAKHSDSLKALSAVSKMKGWLKDSSTHVRVDVKTQTEDMTYQQLKAAHDKLMEKSNNLIQDAEIIEGS